MSRGVAAGPRSSRKLRPGASLGKGGDVPRHRLTRVGRAHHPKGEHVDIDPRGSSLIVILKVPVPLWRNGRRGRLKICCPQGCGSSSLPGGTTTTRSTTTKEGGGVDAVPQ